MKKRTFRMVTFLTLGLSFFNPVFSQEDTDTPEFPESIVTDRPDQTEAPTLTPRGWFQTEIGSQKEYDTDNDNDIITHNTLYPTVLCKYGLSKNFELRLIWEYGDESTRFQNTDHTVQGWNPIAVGSKIRIAEEKGLRPQISLITHIELPWIGKKAFRPTNIIPRYRFLFSHGLTEKLNFSYNVGMEWEDGSSASTTIYTASLAYALSDRFGMFVEGYGFFREKTSADNRLDGGITFLINNNNQLDISSGIGLSEISPDYFISCGYSFRINAFDKEHKKKKD